MANNGAVEFPIYQPAMRVITAITNANPASVTTSFDHDFFDSDFVRLIIPIGFGMQQANGLTGRVTVTSPTTFTINIDTIGFDAFSDPSNNQFAQVIPLGEVNETLRGAMVNTLPSYVR